MKTFVLLIGALILAAVATIVLLVWAYRALKY